MSGPSKPNLAPIESKDQLIAAIGAGEKPRASWRIGTEHEKFVFTLDGHRPVPYAGERGIRALLEGLTRFGWERVTEGENVIALARADGSSISLEPGGQFELSGAPLSNIHQTCDEVNSHLAEVREVAGELGLGLIGLGHTPDWTREEIEWMPKGRYKIMKAYMPKVGKRGIDMMSRTCTIQVNLDYRSEADMVRKFRAALALQPIATALFANSPFVEGKPSGFLSTRSEIWRDTDPDRSGMLPFVFEEGFGYERWVDYILDVPMYFVYRDGDYIDASGQSFRDFMQGELPALPGETPMMGDFFDHMTTAFPEVRLKTYLEMRGADGGQWRKICALPALWVGLLYDETALDAALELTKDWTAEMRQRLRDEVPAKGFAAEIGGRTVQQVALDMLAIARGGLHARSRTDAAGHDEAGFLNIITGYAEAGRSAADMKLELYRTHWGGRVDPLYEEYAY
jgi:glutamate--cysteine ligase